MLSPAGRKVLVTGASGFAGRFLVRELLARGFRVAAAGRAPEPPGELAAFAGGWEWLRLDLDAETDEIERAIASAGPEAVVHLAAQSDVGLSWRDPTATWRANALGTAKLLEALRRLKVRRMVHAGSGDVYGSVSPGELPIGEDRLPRPNNPYAKSKLAGELAATQFGGLSEPEVVLLRPFAHTGPGQRPEFVCPSFARQVARIAARLQPPLVRTGNLEARRDLSDVRDIAAAYADAIDSAPPGVPFNVCSGQSRRVGDVLLRLAELSGLDIRVEVDPAKLRPVDTPEIRGDASRFREAAGWEPRVDFDQTLRDLLAHETALIERGSAVPGASS